MAGDKKLPEARLEGVCVNRRCWCGHEARAAIQRSMKTDSTLTLAPVLCLRLGSAQRSCPANLYFTPRLSHSQSQNGDGAQIGRPALTDTAELRVKYARSRIIRGGKGAEGGSPFNDRRNVRLRELSVSAFTDLILSVRITFPALSFDKSRRLCPRGAV